MQSDNSHTCNKHGKTVSLRCHAEHAHSRSPFTFFLLATGLCEKNVPRHKWRYTVICVPTRKIRIDTHIALYRSLCRRAFMSQTPVWRSVGGYMGIYRDPSGCIGRYRYVCMSVYPPTPLGSERRVRLRFPSPVSPPRSLNLAGPWGGTPRAGGALGRCPEPRVRSNPPPPHSNSMPNASKKAPRWAQRATFCRHRSESPLEAQLAALGAQLGRSRGLQVLQKQRFPDVLDTFQKFEDFVFSSTQIAQDGPKMPQDGDTYP